MKWKKMGLVYAPSGDLWWARSYAWLPTAELLNAQVVRVYFASLDNDQRGRIGYVDLDAENPKRILYESKEPILDIGNIGAFDDSGVNPSCVLNVDHKKYLYYIGWQRCERVPYMLFTGLAVGDQAGARFTRHQPVPVLDRTPSEPFSRAAPFILVEKGVFRMWYWSCQRWSNEDGWIHYNNVIRYAQSTNGVTWTSADTICIAPDEADYSVGRPWLVQDGDAYRMWYSIRSKGRVSYRIGYAESTDGVSWTKRDADVGIEPSDSGWDSEMICYPCVMDANGKRYMFYNGNRHGSTGFGYAVLES